MNSKPPDFLLRNEDFLFSKSGNESAKISALGKLGDHTEGGGSLFIEGFFIADDVGIGYACKDSDLIERVGNLSVVGSWEFDFFECVYFTIFFAFNFVDRSEGSLPYFGDDIKLVHDGMKYNR